MVIQQGLAQEWSVYSVLTLEELEWFTLDQILMLFTERIELVNSMKLIAVLSWTLPHAAQG